MPRVTWCDILLCRQPVKGKLCVNGGKPLLLCPEHRKKALTDHKFAEQIKLLRKAK